MSASVTEVADVQTVLPSGLHFVPQILDILIRITSFLALQRVKHLKKKQKKLA